MIPHTRLSKKCPPVVVQWIEYLRRSLKMRRVFRARASEENLTRLAGYIALVGDIGNETAIKVYSSLVQLLFGWRRIQSLGSHITKLPASSEGLQKVAAAVIAAAKIEDVEKANFPVPNFVEVAIAVPDVEVYVDVCRRSGELTKIREIFHPNTLKATAQRYRGVVGDLADPTYRDQVRTKLKTVT